MKLTFLKDIFASASAKKRISTWPDLISDVMSVATHRRSPIHGELHWRAVSQAGIEIAKLNGGRTEIAMAFGLIHDSQRLCDDWDPEHGLRAAKWASKSKRLLDLIGKDGRDIVAAAARDHEKGKVTQDRNIGTCWDADRINLWRVGLMPHADFFSVLKGDHFQKMRLSYKTGWRTPMTWAELIEGVS